MKRLEWKPEYLLGNDVVDAQHRQIFEYYNNICGTEPQSIDRDRLLDEFVAFAIEHFAEEEGLMERAHYQPALFAHHKASHERILQSLLGLRTKSVDEILEFFGAWLVDHMLIEDRRLEDWLGANNRS